MQQHASKIREKRAWASARHWKSVAKAGIADAVNRVNHFSLRKGFQVTAKKTKGSIQIVEKKSVSKWATFTTPVYMDMAYSGLKTISDVAKVYKCGRATVRRARTTVAEAALSLQKHIAGPVNE